MYHPICQPGRKKIVVLFGFFSSLTLFFICPGWSSVVQLCRLPFFSLIVLPQLFGVCTDFCTDFKIRMLFPFLSFLRIIISPSMFVPYIAPCAYVSHVYNVDE